jgi:hypothetical protein
MGRSLLYFGVLLVILGASACQAGVREPDFGSGAASPSPTLDMTDPLVIDAQSYAEEHGISLEEAVERLSLQDSPGELGALLEANEADTFAGMWIQHEPEYAFVFAFTENGEQTLQPYISGTEFEDIVQIVTHTHTLARLRQDQAMATAAIQELGISGGISVDVINNQVEVSVANADLFAEALSEAGLALPDTAIVESFDPENLPDTLHGGVDTIEAADGQTIYFPRQAPSGMHMEALAQGDLILDDNGCLRLLEAGESNGPLLLWPFDTSIHVNGDVIYVVNEAGERVAEVNQPMRMGGGFSSQAELPGLPIEGCPGPYFIIGELQSLELQSIPDIIADPLTSGPGFAGQFLQSSKAAPALAEISGTLEVSQGCLVVSGYSIIWPPDHFPDRDAEPLEIFVGNQPDQEVVATVGSVISISGSERSADDYRFFTNKVNCPAPYWGVAEKISTD